MTKLEQAIADAAGFLESLHRERDERALTMALTTSAIERAFCEARLQVLERLITEAKGSLEDARRLQFSAAFSFSRRDVKRMLKVGLQVKERKRA